MKRNLPFVLSIIFVISVWIAHYYFLVDLSPEARGTFGDMFGSANAVFSGLAFAGVVYAVFLQRDEISIAREELRRTKKILEDQEASLKNQNESRSIELFESSFFSLLNLHNDIVDKIDITLGSKERRGRDALAGSTNQADVYVNSGGIEKYAEFYRNYGHELGHYFRVMFNIVKLIDGSNLINDRKFYSNIFRAQLSDPEVALLFLNGLSEHGVKFKPLIEKYSLLKHIKADQVRSFEAHSSQYHSNSFE